MQKKEPRIAFWMILPAILVISVIAFFPLFKTFYDSFFSFSLNPRFPREFVGYGNIKPG